AHGDAVEEVVRGEEGEVAAGVAVGVDQFVDVAGDVLLVAGEDDQAVAAQLARAADALEVVVGEEVRLEAARPVPAAKAEVELPELLRQAGGHAAAADVGRRE